MTTPSGRPKIGLALGSGSARGWAHVGVIKALLRNGVRPDVVTGASVGAIVGAVYCLGGLRGFERWLLKLTRREVFSYMDMRPSAGGLIQGKRLLQAFHDNFGDPQFSDLKRPFAAVAADVETGQEIWMQEGPVSEGVRASFSLPGLFSPVRHNGRWLVDGGLVNPVPVSLARALGADRVIAVSLNEGIVGRPFRRAAALAEATGDPGWLDRIMTNVHEHAPWLNLPLRDERSESDANAPGLLQVLVSSLNIMQDRITRSRMAGDPPDLIVAPRLDQIGLLEFERAEEAIAEGEASVHRLAPAIGELFRA